MKKLVSLLRNPAFVVGILVASGSASANFGDVKFYAGLGVDYAKFNPAKTFKNDPNVTQLKTKGMGVVVPILGIKCHENFGLEGGYSFNKKASYKDSGILTVNAADPGVEIKVRNYYLDAMGFMPMADQFELVGGLGFGRVTLKKGAKFYNYPGVDIKLKNRFGIRIKAGVKYNINTNFSVNVLLTHQRASNKLKATNTNASVTERILKNMQSIGMVVTYTF